MPRNVYLQDLEQIDSRDSVHLDEGIIDSGGVYVETDERALVIYKTPKDCNKKMVHLLRKLPLDARSKIHSGTAFRKEKLSKEQWSGESLWDRLMMSVRSFDRVDAVIGKLNRRMVPLYNVSDLLGVFFHQLDVCTNHVKEYKRECLSLQIFEYLLRDIHRTLELVEQDKMSISGFFRSLFDHEKFPPEEMLHAVCQTFKLSVWVLREGSLEMIKYEFDRPDIRISTPEILLIRLEDGQYLATELLNDTAVAMSDTMYTSVVLSKDYLREDTALEAGDSKYGRNRRRAAENTPSDSEEKELEKMSRAAGSQDEMPDLEDDPPEPRAKAVKISSDTENVEQPDTDTEEPQLDVEDHDGTRKKISTKRFTMDDLPEKDSAGRKSRICPSCPHEKFDNFRELREHFSFIHCGEKLYMCPLCGKRLLTYNSFVQHKKAHVGKGSFSCEMEKCNATFATEGTLKSHFKFKHELIECEVCKGKMLRRYLKNHKCIKAEKTAAEVRVACPFCTKNFVSTDTRNNHIFRIHYQRFRYSCKYCDKKFLTPKELVDHKHKECIFIEDCNDAVPSQAETSDIYHKVTSWYDKTTDTIIPLLEGWEDKIVARTLPAPAQTPAKKKVKSEVPKRKRSEPTLDEKLLSRFLKNKPNFSSDEEEKTEPKPKKQIAEVSYDEKNKEEENMDDEDKDATFIPPQ